MVSEESRTRLVAISEGGKKSWSLAGTECTSQTLFVIGSGRLVFLLLEVDYSLANHKKQSLEKGS